MNWPSIVLGVAAPTLGGIWFLTGYLKSRKIDEAWYARSQTGTEVTGATRLPR